ncbi:menaquinone-dependent protoporphyrinogen oxidase [Paenibacillus shirakamiensis]|uniref:Menaquinone-dependent protoporphyrinogen oxidase n=1 Tax=Paenibacillus shirakamiensis TaxID=1265935 RepID=A0ABS4JI19_9BACL|nr:flavodoxin domain-containing protein [Paenibacillus shirakamiensis]MBP2001369.1 menaquinone-dependent protoporphyrinogen oxidase [Paenibacillus shirakamiensis]
MPFLIIYATKSGATELCTKMLAEELGDCTCLNLAEDKPKLEEYDTVILGAGVRDGKIYKPIRDYIKKNKDELLTKNLGFFICNEKPKKTEEIIEQNFSKDLQSAAIAIASFGGYKAYAAPKEGEDQLKGIFVDHIRDFAATFKELPSKATS